MLMVAPGRTAPVGSLTLPRMRPKLPCANSATEKSNTTRVVLSTHVVILVFNVTDVIAPPFPIRRSRLGAAPNVYPVGLSKDLSTAQSDRNPGSASHTKKPILPHGCHVPYVLLGACGLTELPPLTVL